jgi:hypothetical protein
MPSFSRSGAALLITVAVGIAAPAASAATTVSGTKIAASVKKRLTATQGVTAKKVTCPAKVVVRKGNRITCQASFVNGDRSALKITLTNATGKYRLKLVSLLLRKVEADLEKVLAGKNVTAKVTCPKARQVKKDDTFTCTAKTDDGKTGTFDMTQTGDGLVKFKLR